MQKACLLLYVLAILFRVVIKSRGPGIFPGYFYWKIEEKYNQKKSLAVWFPAYLLCLPGNLKS